VLHRAARELAERYQVDLEAEVDYSISVQPDQQHALMRITREAVSNAIRHGKAQRIQVQLAQCGGQRRLMVQDDGQGFDADRAVADNAGYGLVSMRDRARSLPGSLTIDSNPGSGCVVTVTW
jgi:signal transduction histidine kinase